MKAQLVLDNVSGLCLPGDINFSVVDYKIPQVKIEKALIGYPGILGHLLERTYNILAWSHMEFCEISFSTDRIQF